VLRNNYGFTIWGGQRRNFQEYLLSSITQTIGSKNTEKPKGAEGSGGPEKPEGPESTEGPKSTEGPRDESAAMTIEPANKRQRKMTIVACMLKDRKSSSSASDH